jgi:hypothetical protein
MFVDDASLKNARASDRARVTYAAATPAVKEVSGARQHPATSAGNAELRGQLYARLAGSRDTHKATARTLARHRSNLSMVRAQ